MSEFFADGQDSSQLTYKPSSHLFTEPIRYFKANDPYYWEIDNIPIKQVQENILWLKDQVGVKAGTEGSVGRRDFNELLPSAAGDTDIVTVSPGRFMGRVNDAYGTGISKLVIKAYTDYAATVGRYNTELDVQIDDSVLRKIIGETIDSTLGAIGNNGLYDVLQHHVTNPMDNTIRSEWNEQYGTFTQNNIDTGSILSIPKIKLALWKQDTTTHNYPGITTAYVDLQQLSVDFTRVWGAPFRTALVDVANQLSISIPPFDEKDYMNNSPTYVPSTRIDLLFVYTKPIDASSTTIAKPNGSLPAEITSPQLGIVKGAGVISLYGEGNTWTSDSNAQPVSSTFLNSSEFTGQGGRDDSSNFFRARGGLDANGNNQISSPLIDQNQTSMGASGVFGNFPSPDDLMNLAPYIVDGLTGGAKGASNLSLVGQSILPIAYIFVRKGQVAITNNDILDIRPFFRTAELTYNERAGLAAANPPASLANPVVTNSDLAHRLDIFSKNLPTPPGSTFEVEKTVFPDWYSSGQQAPGAYYVVVIKGNFWDMRGAGTDKTVLSDDGKTWDITNAILPAHKEKVHTVFLTIKSHKNSSTGGNTNQLWYRSNINKEFQIMAIQYAPSYSNDTESIQLPLEYDATTGTVTFQTDTNSGGDQVAFEWSVWVRGYTYEETVVIGTGS